MKFIQFRIGDVVQMKKQHPCGSNRWLVLRIGADFKLRCEGCEREVMGPRSKFERSVKEIIRPETAEGE